MKYRILSINILLLSLFFHLNLNAQEISIPDETLTGSDFGNTITIPVNGNSFSSDIVIAAFDISFDTEILTYIGVVNEAPVFDGPVDVAVVPGVPGVLNVNIMDFIGFSNYTFPDIVFELQFTYNGAYSALEFSNVAFVDDLFAEFTPASDNGSVTGYASISATAGDWHTASSWTPLASMGTLTQPGPGHDVTINSGGTVIVDADALCRSLTVASGGQLTNNNNTLTVENDFLVASTSGGNGSFINNGTLTAGATKVQSYVTSGQWHGITPAVQGLTVDDLYLEGTPEVWLKRHNEGTNAFTSITELTDPLNTMQGYMTWVETGADNQTYTFTGDFNTSPASKAMTSVADGYNFVGNTFTSPIDWDATTGWTKSTAANAVYVWNGTQYAEYVNGVGNNGGSQYIDMNQGFFVQASAAGSLSMTTEVCVHDAIISKNNQDAGQIVRLQLEDAGMIDESVVRFIDGATTDFDANFDAHKLFSFNEDQPQLYSTDNDFMAINSLPANYRESIAMDVRGENGNEMTISATETADLDVIYLQDEANGNIVDLTKESYSFTYDSGITDRFTLLFIITDINENLDIFDAKVFASNGAIQVMFSEIQNVDINVFNLLGQNVASQSATGTVSSINVQQSGYYLVKLSNGTKVSTQKVFIK